MPIYSKNYTVKWSEVDPNMHLRGTVYMDFADHTRMAMLESYGMGLDYMKKHQFGPILFEVNTKFFKEIKLNESISVSVILDYLSPDHRKFGLSHQIFTQDNTLAAEVKVHGAFMDLKTRKIRIIPKKIIEIFQHLKSILPTNSPNLR